MKTVKFRLPPTNRWLEFMLSQVADPGCAHRRNLGYNDLVSRAMAAAKQGFLAWNGAKVWYIGVGNWYVSGYSADGRDTDAVVARVIGKLMWEQGDLPCPVECPSCHANNASHVAPCWSCGQPLPGAF